MYAGVEYDVDIAFAGGRNFLNMVFVYNVRAVNADVICSGIL